MPRPRTDNQQPPLDWNPTQAVDDPIINTPYDEPSHHWVYEGGVPYMHSGRRPASYWYKTKRTGEVQDELFREESRDDLPLVNALRNDVRRWRDSGYRGATAVTRELLAWWARDDMPRRLFFCQREAVETFIYLLELALPGRLRTTGFQNFEVDAANIERMLRGEMPNFTGLTEDFFPRLIDAPSDADLQPLIRLACKMATGSGKTLVMAAMITWAFCNRAKNPSSIHFPNAVLVCAPNLTVKKRLQVLLPSDPDNFYDAFGIVPSKYREVLNSGNVLITNWHVFAPKSEHTEGGKSWSVVQKGEETNDAFAINRLGDLAHRLPILVLNDEGHHCWRPRVLSDEEKKKARKQPQQEDMAVIDLEQEEEEARVWLAGLDRLNNCGLAGKEQDGKVRKAILACLDLSATPFHLSSSGYPEGSPFPWIVSDFGLVDAIECGITKVPRLPVKDDLGQRDDAGRPDPKYFRLWENIKDELHPGDYIKKGVPKPQAIFEAAQGALLTLASQWKMQFEALRDDAAGKPFIPPVLIVVCDNIEQSQLFYERISGEQEVEVRTEDGKTVKTKRFGSSSVLAEFANSEGAQRTFRIDSKLLAKIETGEGESRDQAALRAREIIDTVGKRGGAGEQLRCIVSVSMLTEGWDAQNVTHVLGVRAFGSQLLCEQVVGRGLRRMNYTPDPASGKLAPEYVDVYGIPFSLIPFKGKKKEKEGPDPVYRSIYAVPERNAFEIRLPVVDSYVYSLKERGITCDVDALEPYLLDGEPGTVYLRPTRGIVEDASSVQDVGDFVKQTREEYYRTVRLQQIVFRLAQLILDDLLSGAEDGMEERAKLQFLARHHLYPEIVHIVRAYIETKLILPPGTDLREIALDRNISKIRERIRDNILPVVTSGEATLLPVQNSFHPYATTADVNYSTTRPVVDLVKSHLNRAMVQAGWEPRAIDIMEDLDCIECFAPNDRQIGLLIPYEYEETKHNYEPDFIVRLTNGMYVLLEIKGMAGMVHDPNKVFAKNAAAKKWVTAVNNAGRYGKWVFEICYDLIEMRPMLEKHAGVEREASIFRLIPATAETIWTSCVPLTSLRAAAGKFSAEQLDLDESADWADQWVTWEGAPRFERGMFVARVLGKSMEPDIPDGAYCLFRAPRQGSREGRTVLVWHSGISDPHTGGQYTVKVYHSEKRGAEEGGWRHTRITLSPRNPEYDDIILEPEDEGEVRILAELAGVVGEPQ